MAPSDSPSLVGDMDVHKVVPLAPGVLPELCDVIALVGDHIDHLMREEGGERRSWGNLGPGPFAPRSPYPLRLQALKKLVFYRHIAHVTPKS